jgi:hypothetical protein
LADVTKSAKSAKLAARKAQLEKRLEANFAKMKRYVAQGGMTAFAKGMIQQATDAGLSESEFSSLIMEAALREKRSTESNEQAFSRFYSAPENVAVMKVHRMIAEGQLAKASLLTQVQVEPVMTETGRTNVQTDAEGAYRQLFEQAQRLAAAGRYRSVASAFAALFQDSKNSELAARSLGRSSPT